MARLLCIYSPAIVLAIAALLQLLGWYEQGMGLLALSIAVGLHISNVRHK